MPAPVINNTPVRNFRIYTGFTKAPDNDVCNVALDVSSALDGHPVFTSPPFTSAQLTTLETTFNTDMTAARKRGTDRTLTKNISRQALVDALVQDALYCQGLARHDLNTLLTSGYEVVSTNRTPGPLDTPQIVSIDNSVSGQLTVRGGTVLNGRMYQLQYSLDNGGTWTNASNNYTSARRMLLAPTTPGKTYLIQIAALGGSTGQSAWSNPVSIMAT
ncbi:MAG TPA: fibronectin type III domain-containing protein [Verrucomicrobiae bacterium]|nr:fibronectin type III domain-containing protein [Verrucomicrobiae bacterium]